ncbi:zinc finger protein 64 [Gastrophryne carolinensis]
MVHNTDRSQEMANANQGQVPSMVNNGHNIAHQTSRATHKTRLTMQMGNKFQVMVHDTDSSQEMANANQGQVPSTVNKGHKIGHQTSRATHKTRLTMQMGNKFQVMVHDTDSSQEMANANQGQVPSTVNKDYVICIAMEQQVFETDAKCDIVYDACCNDADFDTNYEAFSGAPAVVVEIAPDIHICGICKSHFNNLDAFVAHKQSGCQLTSAAATATASTVQFIASEAVAPTQTVARTITSETQTITVTAPEFVFEHGYQTILPSGDSATPTLARGGPAAAKCRSRKASAPQKKQSCTFPGCQFKTAYGLKDMERHMRTHTGDKPHKCEMCGKCFSRKDKLKTHIRSHTGEKPYKCKECDYCAADSSSLCKHMRIHTDERPFKCQICPYASRNSSQLTVHLRSHTGDAPFQCTLCSSKFKINSDLRRHMRVHTGEKPYRCEFCDFYCAMKGNLKSHIRIKHNVQSTLKCPQCDFTCGSKADLRLHLRAHLPEQPVKCLECNYSCANRTALRVHERIHSQDRPFKCHLCHFDTKQRSNLTTHIKKVHSDSTYSERPDWKYARKSNIVEAKRTFKCDLCEASFVRADSLRSHKKQHDEILLHRAQELSVLQLSMQADNMEAEKQDKGHEVAAYIVGKIKVGEAVSAMNSSEGVTNGHDSVAGCQSYILNHGSIMASPQSLTSQVVVCETVVPSSPRRDSDEDSIQEVLIENGDDSDRESPGHPDYISAPAMSCPDFEGLNSLMQEEATVVIVDGEGGENLGTSSPIYHSSPDSPEQGYAVVAGDGGSERLCPADSIPD